MHLKKVIILLFSIIIVEVLLLGNRYKITAYRDVCNQGKSKTNYIIIVDTTTNSLSVFKEGKLFKTYKVASGKSTTPSPIGTWKIIGKDTWGSGFGGRWMGLNVPWGKYGIHGTLAPNSIGWNSSHGCIRMKNNEVKELYSYIPVGTTVVISGGNYGRFGEYLRVLRPGMRGSDVYQLQLVLREKGYYKSNPDGIYGDYFKSVVHEFQKKNGLQVTDTIGNSFYSKLGIHLVD
ncbi:L,D-transpeptidase family protein [Clostridium sp. JN-1]|uniref:L,D-transpeptidase family protein n=1 Tax=Clostridium sp. JN-1 TaxID=2483110 RepID=UPI001FAAE1C8|nr:L,D-transpeptidase family protein [Clostridium sp. JN-1]